MGWCRGIFFSSCPFKPSDATRRGGGFLQRFSEVVIELHPNKTITIALPLGYRLYGAARFSITTTPQYLAHMLQELQ